MRSGEGDERVWSVRNLCIGTFTYHLANVKNHQGRTDVHVVGRAGRASPGSESLRAGVDFPLALPPGGTLLNGKQGCHEAKDLRNRLLADRRQNRRYLNFRRRRPRRSRHSLRGYSTTRIDQSRG